MVRFEVVLKDRSTELVEGAESYQQEGQMTTFFTSPTGRERVDSWSTRVASIRTSEILMIRRVEVDGPVRLAGVG